MTLDIFDILFLPFLFFIGLITSYEDIRHGKVRNKWIRLGLVWGVLIIALLYLWYPIASPVSRFFYFEVLGRLEGSVAPVFTVSLAYLNKVVLNAVISLALAYSMWKANAWAAGDAKLFFIYALLLPLKYYWKSFLPIFPSFVLMINIFIPIFAYLLIRSAFFNARYFYLKIIRRSAQDDAEKKDQRKAEKENGFWEKAKTRLVMVIAFISIFLVFGLLQGPIKSNFSIDISSFQAFIFAAIILFSGSLAKVFKKTITFWLVLGILVSILSYGLATSPAATWQSFYQSVLTMAIFMTIWGILRKMVDFHVLKTATREIETEDLKAKMNLDENIVNEIKNDKEFFKQIGSIYPEGLDEQQSEAVKKWLLEKKKTKVKIYQPFPFVLWMFIGVIITIILKSSLFHLFIKVGPGS
ncbi:prepilin peptidase [Patescibacteria group bacterium]|nr:prepilin peptidase [Patescibacteria group bacterium]